MELVVGLVGAGSPEEELLVRAGGSPEEELLEIRSGRVGHRRKNSCVCCGPPEEELLLLSLVGHRRKNSCVCGQVFARPERLAKELKRWTGNC